MLQLLAQLTLAYQQLILSINSSLSIEEKDTLIHLGQLLTEYRSKNQQELSLDQLLQLFQLKENLINNIKKLLSNIKDFSIDFNSINILGDDINIELIRQCINNQKITHLHDWLRIAKASRDIAIQLSAFPQILKLVRNIDDYIEILNKERFIALEVAKKTYIVSIISNWDNLKKVYQTKNSEEIKIELIKHDKIKALLKDNSEVINLLSTAKEN